jgi:hypothetical protein
MARASGIGSICESRTSISRSIHSLMPRRRWNKGYVNFSRISARRRRSIHATVTAAWLHATRHVMEGCGATADFQQFLDGGGARLLDKTIMAAHYSPQVLSSPEARRAFVPPDRKKFPE